MIPALIAAGVFAVLPAETQDELERCGVDAPEMQRLLELEQQAFDQDMEGGWRAVASEEACKNAAGEVIKAYLLYSGPEPTSVSALRWHAGQMKAYAEKTDKALAFFWSTYRPPAENAEGPIDFNAYVDATIAFLEKDRTALEAARAKLAAQTVSEERVASLKKFLEENPNIKMDIYAKPNLHVADSFLACFDQPYSVAYGDCETEAEAP